MRNMELKQEGRFFWGWWIVLVGFLTMALGYASFIMTIGVFVIPVTTDLNSGISEFIMYMMIQSIVALIISPYIGKIMEKNNIKKIMGISTIIAFAGFFIFSRATSLWNIYIGAVVIGVAFVSLTVVPFSILINNWFGGKIKGTAMGFTFCGVGIGGLFLIPIMNEIIMAYSWRTAYLVTALIFVVIILPLILIFVVKTPEEKGFVRMGEDEKEPAKSGMTGAAAKKTSMLWLAVMSIVICVFASSAVVANGVSYFIETGFSPAQAALFGGLMSGALVLGNPIVGVFCDKTSIKAGAIAGVLIYAVGFLCLIFMQGSPSWIIGFIICYGLGGASVMVIPPLLVVALFGQKDFGTLTGIMNTATCIGGAFGGTIAGWVFDKTQSYMIFWGVAIAAMLVAAVLRLIAFSVKKRKYADSHA